jgi:hypothetical protein
MDTRSYLAFKDSALVASGTPAEVAAAVKRIADDESTLHPDVLVFDAATSAPVDFDLRGSLDDVIARPTPHAPAPAAPRGPGRPRLGVTPREITLLPRHWSWLAEQPGGASAALRKLVDKAMREPNPAGAADATYRFITAIAGNLPGYEAATRALYAGDRAGFDSATAEWPADVRAHARTLAAPALAGERESA